VVFIDGQNLFHATREAFGYTHPNYDVQALAQRLCAAQLRVPGERERPDRSNVNTWIGAT